MDVINTKLASDRRFVFLVREAVCSTEKKRNFQHPLGGKEMRKSSQYLSSTALYLSKTIFIETTPQGSLCLELNEVLYFSSHFTS